MNLDLETLKYIKLQFDICSDFSTRSQGYTWLCTSIDKMENNLHDINESSDTIVSKKTPEGYALYCVSSDALVYRKPCKTWCGSEHCLSIKTKK